MRFDRNIRRRRFLVEAGVAAGALLPRLAVSAQSQKLRIGIMLPYTGTYAQLGTAITNGFKLAVSERGGKLGGREIEYFTVDDEADPAKGRISILSPLARALVGKTVGDTVTAQLPGGRKTFEILEVNFPWPE